MLVLDILGIQLTLEAQVGCGNTVKEFKAKVDADAEVKKKIEVLRAEVEVFASKFPMPGHDDI